MTVTTNAAPIVKGSPEWSARMAAVAPANVPDKFKRPDGTVNMEALTQAYRELEQKQSGKPVVEQPAVETVVESAEAPSLDSLLTAAPATSGWDAAQAELATDGKISDATKAALKSKHGASDAVISSLEAGFKAQQSVTTSKLAESVGGMENLKATLQFAASKLDPAGVKALKASLTGPMGPLVLKGLAAELAGTKVVTATPKGEPKSILDIATGGGTGGAVVPFKSAAEMMAAIRSPKYHQDPEFRDQVARRIHAGSK